MMVIEHSKYTTDHMIHYFFQEELWWFNFSFFELAKGEEEFDDQLMQMTAKRINYTVLIYE
jgi:hypothetical protein